jgi:ABC-type transporter Mla subunit MlaD
MAANEKKLNQVVDDVSTFTAVLNKRSNNIDTMLVDASELAHKLNGQADRLDGILKNVENFTGGNDKMTRAGRWARSSALRGISARIQKAFYSVAAETMFRRIVDAKKR